MAGLEEKLQAVVNTLQSINTPTFNSAFGEDKEFLMMKKELGQMQSALMQVQNGMLNIGAKATAGKMSAKHAAHLKPEVWMNSKNKPFLKFAADIRNWATAVCKDMTEVMKAAEKLKADEAMNKAKAERVSSQAAEKYEEMDELLY